MNDRTEVLTKLATRLSQASEHDPDMRAAADAIRRLALDAQFLANGILNMLELMKQPELVTEFTDTAHARLLSGIALRYGSIDPVGVVMPSLIRCPFCGVLGGAMQLYVGSGRYAVECVCGAQAPSATTRAGARDNWNTRTPTRGVVELNAPLVAMLATYVESVGNEALAHSLRDMIGEMEDVNDDSDDNDDERCA